ncbi:MAG: POTRA domain-containing protein, partial [Candidatus Thiodiazotropha taylori]
MGFTILSNTRQQLEKLTDKDILIKPDLGNHSSTDFWRATEMIDNGATAATQMAEQLIQLSITKAQYAAHLASIRQREKVSPVIDRISFDNQSPLSTDVLRANISASKGDQLDIAKLEEEINQLYGMNIFGRVDYNLLQKEQENELKIRATEKEWGPNYLRFGLTMETNFDGSGIFNLASSHTMTPINSMGGEWRTELQIGHEQRITTELYQPLDNHLRYYFRTLLGYYETHAGVFESGRQVVDLNVNYSNFLLAGGRQFGNWGQLEIGAYAGTGDVSPYIGDLSTSSEDINFGTWVVTFTYDQLDSINFPRDGLMANISWSASRDELGAEDEYDP